MKNQLNIEFYRNHVGNGVGGIVAVGTPRTFLFERGTLRALHNYAPNLE